MKLSEIVFPVYRLKDAKPECIDDVYFYVGYTFDKETGDIDTIYKIVDDKNVDGSTLAMRRLKIPGKLLYKLRYAFFFISDLLKVVKPDTWFIDSTGKIFNYVKDSYVPLLFKEITNIIRISGATLLEIKGVPGRYMCLFPPTKEEKYAGLLKIAPHSYILYGVFKEKYSDTIRKI